MNHLMHYEKTIENYGVSGKLKTRMKDFLNLSIHNDEVMYFVLPSKVVVDETLYNTYGIGAYSEGMVVDYVADLSSVLEKVKSLVDLCNEKKLSLIHLRDVVDNFINEQHMFV